MSNSQIELNEDTTITLNYTDILSIFAATKMIKTCGSAAGSFAAEIEDRLESKLKDSTK